MVPDLAEENCRNNRGGEFSHVHEKFFFCAVLTQI